MTRLVKRLHEKGWPRALVRLAAAGHAEKASRTARGKPVFGLEGIESPEGEQWLRDRRSRQR